MIGNLKKYKTTEYAIYDEDGELIDVINLNKKEVKQYIKDYPEYTLEELEESINDDE